MAITFGRKSTTKLPDDSKGVVLLVMWLGRNGVGTIAAKSKQA
jgi:Trk-type K+ transport system membrane component